MITQAIDVPRKVETTAELEEMGEKSDDTEPEKINVHKHAESTEQDDIIEDVNTDDLSEGEILVPKKRRRTVRKVQPSGEKDLKSNRKSKREQRNKKQGKQSKRKVDKKGRRIPLTSQPSIDAITKAKPVSLRTAV